MRLSERLIVYALCAIIFSSVAYAVTEDFDTFVSGRSSATTPLGSGDKVVIIQGGVTKYLAGNAFATLNDSQTLTNKTISGSSNTITLLAGSQLSGTVGVANGGTGLASGTSGGVPCFTGSTTIASSAALTANSPVVGGGAGACPSVGTTTGPGTLFLTGTGSYTNGHGLVINASGQVIDSSAAAFTNVAQIFTAQQTLGTTLGGENTQAGTTYTFAATDCGQTVKFTSSTAVTATVPSLPQSPGKCSIAVLQQGAGQVTFVGGSGVTVANPDGFTKTFGQNAVVFLYGDATNHVVLGGRGA